MQSWVSGRILFQQLQISSLLPNICMNIRMKILRIFKEGSFYGWITLCAMCTTMCTEYWVPYSPQRGLLIKGPNPTSRTIILLLSPAKKEMKKETKNMNCVCVEVGNWGQINRKLGDTVLKLWISACFWLCVFVSLCVFVYACVCVCMCVFVFLKWPIECVCMYVCVYVFLKWPIE